MDSPFDLPPGLAKGAGEHLDLRIGVMDDGNVALDFGSPVSWIAFSPERALELSRLLVEEAGKATNTTYRIEIKKEGG